MTIFKKTILFTVALTSFLGMALGQDAEIRQLSNFSAIDVSGSIEVQLVQGDAASMDVQVKNAELDELISEVKGSELKLRFKKKGIFNWNNKRKAEITLYYVHLEEIDASAGAEITAKNSIENEVFDIEISSGAEIDIDINADDINIDASSGSDIRLSGVAKNAEIDVSSGAYIKALELKVDHVSADASSGGSIRITSLKSINAEASSGGSVKYGGNPSKENLSPSKYSGGSVTKI